MARNGSSYRSRFVITFTNMKIYFETLIVHVSFNIWSAILSVVSNFIRFKIKLKLIKKFELNVTKNILGEDF